MENPTPTIQRKRRSDRYQQPDAAAPAAPAPTPAENVGYQRVPRAARFADPAQPSAPIPPQRMQSAPHPQYQPVQRVQRTIPTPQQAPFTDAPPPAMARPPKPQAPAKAKKPGYRMPWWITACIIGLLFGILALTAAQNMMQAGLVQRQQERDAAYQAVIDNHPIYYKDLIEQYAAEYNLRPAFMCAIILNESSFRTNAESGVGARGLMQLMPDTAEWIAGKLDVGGYTFERMYDAESNIRFGAWYLNYLSKLFRGDPVAMACAYHAGQSTVANWLSDRSISPDGVTLPMENLPDGPTKTYAGRVTRAYGIYDALYFHAFNRAEDYDGPLTLSVLADDADPG